MIKKFLNWYNNNLIKSPIIVLITTIVVIFAGMGSFYSGVQAISGFSKFIKNSVFVNNEVYQKIEQVNTGLNAEFVDQILGKPSVLRPMSDVANNPFSKYFERLYVSDNYFIYVITDKNNSILSYAVTIRKSNFHPLVPLDIGNAIKENEVKNLRLGEMKLSDLKSKPMKISADISSKFICYSELHYFGNPGLYKHYLFGYAPTGCRMLTDEQILIITDLANNNEKINEKQLEGFRNDFVPNSYCVISELVDDELFEYLSESMIGVDYFDAREFK